jgi:hypothetical protein
MRQHSSFGVASTATCELEIHDIVRTYAVEDVQDMIGYALRLLFELLIPNEAVVAAYETYSLEIW